MMPCALNKNNKIHMTSMNYRYIVSYIFDNKKRKSRLLKNVFVYTYLGYYFSLVFFSINLCFYKDFLTFSEQCVLCRVILSALNMLS